MCRYIGQHANAHARADPASRGGHTLTVANSSPDAGVWQWLLPRTWTAMPALPQRPVFHAGSLHRVQAVHSDTGVPLAKATRGLRW